MIQLYTGNGKGKTTAAVGAAMRAVGSGRTVVFAQFMKGNDSGELHSLEKIPGIEICRSRKEFGFYRTLSEAEKEQLRAEHNRILDILWEAAAKPQAADIFAPGAPDRGRVGMVILDEITYPVNWGLVDCDKLKKLLEFGKTEELEIILTGRNAASFLQDAADYITEMTAVRHPYEKGIAARKGIEY